MSMENSFIHRLAERLRNSRDFSISLMVHIIFVALFGGTVLFQAAQAPPDFEGGGEEGFVGAEQAVAAPPVQQQIIPPPRTLPSPPHS